MLHDYKSIEIKKNKDLKNNFLFADFKEHKLSCNIYKGNFYLDSYNYFLINQDYKTFNDLFSRDLTQNNSHFYSEKFYNNLLNNIENLKVFKNLIILGSNAADNYYSNLLQFIPRIFFIKRNNIKIAIHRNSSTNLREFIKLILGRNNIQFSFVYLDDGFFTFTECEMPQFLNLQYSIRILKKFLFPTNSSSKSKKIYVTRADSSYRKIINESDIIPILRKKGYKVINPQLYSIDEQINIFSQAEKIVSPHGSNLANLVFCKPGTEVYEIGPEFNNSIEKVFENRYKFIADINHLKYYRFIADTVKVENHSELALKYINKNILQNSNYYKNLIVKLKDIKKIQ